MTVAAGFSAWLQSEARYQSANVAGAAAAWGSKAVSSEIVSPFAFQQHAAAEAVRQAQFMAGPLARDTMLVKGYRSDLVGIAALLSGDRLDYNAGSIVFVLEADETAFPNHTRLTVLKRL